MTNMEMMMKAWNPVPPEAFYCDCCRCVKGDYGGCIDAEAIWQSQVDRGIIHELDYFIAKDENGVAL